MTADPHVCWRCPLKGRKAQQAVSPDPFGPAADTIKLCVPCAFEREQHPNKPRPMPLVG